MLAWDRWIRRRRDPGAEPARAGPVLALSAVGLVTHPTLDWMNTYGMRWGLPLDGSWSYGDALFIIDPWIWLILGGSVALASSPGRWGLRAWAALAGLTTSFVFVALPDARLPWALGILVILLLYARWSPTTKEVGRRLVRAAGAVVLLYIGGLVTLDGWAGRQIIRLAQAEGLTARDIMVSPLGGNPFASQVELLTDDGYVPGVHRWKGTPRVELFPERAVPLVSGPNGVSGEELEEVITSARMLPDVRDYLVWSRYPYFHVEPDGNGWQVTVSDARYDGVAGAGGLSGLTVMVERRGGP